MVEICAEANRRDLFCCWISPTVVTVYASSGPTERLRRQCQRRRNKPLHVTISEAVSQRPYVRDTFPWLPTTLNTCEESCDDDAFPFSDLVWRLRLSFEQTARGDGNTFSFFFCFNEKLTDLFSSSLRETEKEREKEIRVVISASVQCERST